MTTDYGRDISCLDSLRPGRFVSGVRLVAEAAYRRLNTPRGLLRGGEEEENYGLDLTALVGGSSTKADAASLPGRIAVELKKDDRIDTVDVEVLPSVDGPATSLQITISAVTIQDEAFELVLLASDVTVELLKVST